MFDLDYVLFKGYDVIECIGNDFLIFDVNDYYDVFVVCFDWFFDFGDYC